LYFFTVVKITSILRKNTIEYQLSIEFRASQQSVQ